jgi:hypothetical protein
MGQDFVEVRLAVPWSDIPPFTMPDAACMQTAVPAWCICLVMCDAIAPASSTLKHGRPSEPMCDKISVASHACPEGGDRQPLPACTCAYGK